jgi:hypothetical protein
VKRTPTKGGSSDGRGESGQGVSDGN